MKESEWQMPLNSFICGAFVCICGQKSVGPERSFRRCLLSASRGPGMI